MMPSVAAGPMTGMHMSESIPRGAAPSYMMSSHQSSMSMGYNPAPTPGVHPGMPATYTASCLPFTASSIFYNVYKDMLTTHLLSYHITSILAGQQSAMLYVDQLV